MEITRLELAKIIGEKTLQYNDPKVLAREIAAYLLEVGRIDDLEPLMRDVMAYREEHGVVEADFVSAHELSEEIKNDAKDLLAAHYPKSKKILITNTDDEQTIGGFKVRTAHKQLDMSVRGKLDEFKRLTHKGTN